MKKEDFLIIITGLIALGLIILASFILPSKILKETGKVNVITDAEVYKIGSALKVKIENNSNKDICFSSCYPYYFEKKSGEWIFYNYEACPKKDLANYCIDSKTVKAFELIIPSISAGIHRIAVSACIECNTSELFKQDQKFYSNNFDIKK